MYKHVTWTELVGVFGRAFGAVALCLAATVFLMFPVVAALMVGP